MTSTLGPISGEKRISHRITAPYMRVPMGE